jgi:hypothetical protein
MDMEKFFRKYVWDEQRTPYLVPVARMTRRQADYEILFYAVITGVMFALVAVAALSDRLPHGGAQGVSLYAFTQVCAALLLGVTISVWSALYCASAPLAALLYFALFGFHPSLGAGDKTLLIVAMILWLWYCRRLLAIARAYPSLAESSGQH